MVHSKILTIKEQSLNVPAKDKGAIILRFDSVSEKREEIILVKLLACGLFEGSEIEHIARINASWS